MVFDMMICNKRHSRKFKVDRVLPVVAQGKMRNARSIIPV